MIKAVRGFNDILPQEGYLWRTLEHEAVRIFSTYGYLPIKTPVLERTELFSRSIGQTTDIVEKEMYTFTDRHGTSLTMRPEGTASVVRAYIEHRLHESPLLKVYYLGPMFRYERPQKGRYRQFHQLGVEVLGDRSPLAEAEMLEMLMDYLARLGLEGLSLQINSLGCAGCRPSYRDRLLGFLKERHDTLCPDCQRRIEANPLRALDCKVPRCVETTRDAPSILDTLCQDCATHFEMVQGALSTREVSFDLNPRMVRGLDYYTRTTFEVVSEGLGSQNTVAAGGRYDNLVRELGGPDTPCIGFAIGLERLVMLMKDRGVHEEAPLVVVVPLGPVALDRAVGLVRGLRGKGLRVVEDFSTTTLKKRMKRADRMGARFTVILGDDEIGRGVAALKDMQSARQEDVPFDELYERLTSAR